MGYGLKYQAISGKYLNIYSSVLNRHKKTLSQIQYNPLPLIEIIENIY